MNERELFIAALQMEDPAERAAYLDQACRGDAGLRQRLEALLTAFVQAGSFLQQPAADPGATSDRDPAAPLRTGAPAAPLEEPGTVIGPYKLLQQIGEGGMGTVWMAEQTQPVQRKVAIKLIKSGMDSRQVLARFEAERQALALMDHPNIAKVFEAGTTSEVRGQKSEVRTEDANRVALNSDLCPLTSGGGRPYFVMELVKGTPITQYCDEHHLPPKERLELFIPVCQAVQHAHQKGIIHRDLKPSNVMVCLYDGKPVPKIIDFGVAKAMGTKLTDHTLFTEFGSVVGTLEYMSPEQAEVNQLDIDTRSDIYSLGVLLYELLTGTTPLQRKRLKEAAFLEVLRIIREEEPPKPSTRLTTTEELPSIAANRGLEPLKLSRLVRGELDWIVMKALEKDRNRRYETANSLARDIDRYLHDEPVQACPPGAGYRLRKFARRNRAALTMVGTATALLVLVAVGALVAAFWYQRVAHDAGLARDDAEQARKDEAAALRHAEMTLTDMHTTHGVMAGDQGDPALAVLWFANAARLARQDPEREYANRVRVRTWGRLAPTPIRALPHPGQELSHMSFHPQGWHLLTVSRQQKCIVWDLDQERPLPWASGDKPVSCAAWSPDGRWLAMGTPKGVVEVYRFPAGEVLHRLVHRGPIHALAFSPDGHFLALASDGVRIWDCRTHAFVSAELVHPKPVLTLAFNSRGDRLATGCEDDQARVFAVPDNHRRGKPLFDAVPHSSQLAPAFSNQDRWLLTAPRGQPSDPADRRCLQIDWRDPETGKLSQSIPFNAVNTVAISPDGKHFAVGEYLGARLGDVALRRLVGQHMPNRFFAMSCAFSPDGRTLLTASRDGTGQLWSVPGGEPVGPPLPHQGRVILAAYSDTGRFFATGQGDGLVRVWRPALPNPRDYRLAADGEVSGVALSHDGQHMLATGTALPGYGSFLRSTRVYHVATGKPAGPPLAVNSLGPHAALSPDGQHAVTVSSRDAPAGKAGSLQFWNWHTGEKLFDPVPLPALPDGVVYSPDG